MIDLLELIKNDSAVANAVDLIVGCRVEFDVNDLADMTEEQYAVVEPFYNRAISDVVAERINKAKANGEVGFDMPIEKIAEDAVAKAVEAFNKDENAVAWFWSATLMRFQETAETEEEARSRILQLAVTGW